MKTYSNILALILAAGRGTRMNLSLLANTKRDLSPFVGATRDSSLPKPLIPLANRPIIQYVINSISCCHIHKIVIVVGYQAELIMSELGNQYEYVLQSEQKGTAHAVHQATSVISHYEKVLVLVGDSPFIQPDSIKRLIHQHAETQAACSFLTATFPIHFAYARVIRDSDGNVIQCVEERYASKKEKQIREYLTSHYIFDSHVLLEFINEIEADPDTHESYLTDIIGILVDHGYKVNTVHIDDYKQLVGLNTPEDLLWAEHILKDYYGDS